MEDNTFLEKLKIAGFRTDTPAHLLEAYICLTSIFLYVDKAGSQPESKDIYNLLAWLNTNPNVLRERHIFIPAAVEDVAPVFLEIFDTSKSLGLVSYCRLLMGDCSFDWNEALSLIEPQESDPYQGNPAMQLFLALSLDFTWYSEDLYSAYCEKAAWHKAKIILPREAFEKLYCCITGQKTLQYTHAKRTNALEVRDRLLKLFFSREQIMKMVTCVDEHRDALYSKAINYRPAYFGKLLEGDSKLFTKLRVASQVDEVLELLKSPLSASELLAALMLCNNKDDDLTECGLILPWLLRRLNGAGPILAVNPAPAFISNWQENAAPGADFTVPFEEAVLPMSKEFSAYTFRPVGKLAQYAGNYKNIVYFARDLAEEQIKQHLEQLCQSADVVYAVLPDHEVKRLGFLPGNWCTEEIWFLPSGLSSGKQKKKVLAVLRQGTQPETVKTYRWGSREKDKGQQVFCQTVSPLRIPLASFLSGRTPRNAFELARLSEKERGRRKLPIEYRYSEELSFWYTATDQKDGKEKVCVYLCEQPSKRQKRGKLARGKVIENSMVWKASIGREEIEDWIETTAVFKERLCNAAYRQISDRLLGRPISLKTLFYYMKDSLQLSEEAKRVCLKHLRGSLGQWKLPGTEFYELAQAIDQCQTDSREETLLLWEALNAVLNRAVQKRYIKANPLDAEAKRRAAEARALQAVRGTAKKNFTVEEEKKIVSFLLEGLKDRVMAGAVLVNFFTGLPIDVIAALCWNDLKPIPYTDKYRLDICKRMVKNGEIEPLTGKNECRLIPIMSFLAEQLLKLKELRHSERPELKDRDFDKLRMFEPTVSVDLVDKIRRTRREAEEKAGIDPDVFALPGPGDGQATDLNDYGGNRFKMNFEMRCYGECSMKDAEVKYLLRNRMPDTLSEHYVDYGHDCLQERMAAKLDRWGRRWQRGEICTYKEPVQRAETVVATPGNERDNSLVVQYTGKDLELVCEARHGLRYQCIVLEEEKA